MSNESPPAASPLIDADSLAAALAGQTRPIVLDASFDLAEPAAGEREYRAAHIPGALYLHLERDLSGAKHAADGSFRGRHPLPEKADFASLIGRCGIAADSQVVFVDRQGGMMAARGWWMLHWLGHHDVRVLDGGMAAWLGIGGAVEEGWNQPVDGPVYSSSGPAWPTIEAAALLSRLGRMPLLDARAPERFRGEVETLDAAAGHIPGARNRFFKENLLANGLFKPADQLLAEFLPLLAGRSPVDVVHQCGSGVTACHNMLAMEMAGLSGSCLYAGSWSEWSSDSSRPIARG